MKNRHLPISEILDQVKKFDWEAQNSIDTYLTKRILDEAQELENEMLPFGTNYEAVKNELADVLIFAIQLAELKGWHINEIIMEKLKINDKKRKEKGIKDE